MVRRVAAPARAMAEEAKAPSTVDRVTELGVGEFPRGTVDRAAPLSPPAAVVGVDGVGPDIVDVFFLPTPFLLSSICRAFLQPLSSRGWPG